MYPHLIEFGNVKNKVISRGYECQECGARLEATDNVRAREHFAMVHEHNGYRIGKNEASKMMLAKPPLHFTDDEAKKRLDRIVLHTADDAQFESTLWNAIGIEGERVYSYRLAPDIYGLILRSQAKELGLLPTNERTTND